ncbi:MAG: acetate kinase, partial [Actinomycetota bacterium]
MRILVINSGSSSLKYQLIDTHSKELLVKGIVEEIEASKYSAALTEVLNQLTESGFELTTIAAVGHRVVHGGALFSKPTLVNSEVIAGIKSLVPL